MLIVYLYSYLKTPWHIFTAAAFATVFEEKVKMIGAPKGKFGANEKGWWCAGPKKWGSRTKAGNGVFPISSRQRANAMGDGISKKHETGVIAAI